MDTGEVDGAPVRHAGVRHSAAAARHLWSHSAVCLHVQRRPHWLLLILGDRVDVLEGRVATLLKGQPDNPITETGVLAEFKRSAFRTRFGQHRADLKHQPLDLLLWAAPYVAMAGDIYMLAQGRPARRALR